MYQGKYASAEKPVRKKAASTKGTRLFYSIYAAVLLVLCIGIVIAMSALNDWLVRFEASQPDTKAQQAFDRYFADPDWGSIYDLSGLGNTAYEGKDAFIAYMETKVGTTALTYIKTSAGLSGGQKYIVKLDGENIATFTLRNAVQSDLEIPDWELDTVEVLLTRQEHVMIYAQPDHTVAVNGVPLSEQEIVLTSTTAAEDYLPEGVHGKRSVLYYVSGLLTAPQVTVTDGQGNSVETVYDAQSKAYSQASDAPSLPDDLKNRFVDATQAYCKHMINAGGKVSSYFDTSKQIYKTIARTEMWFKGYSGYEFTPAEITDFYVYNDSLVSARVRLTLNVTRSSNGSVKRFDVDNTLFMEKKSNGKWMVIEMVNVDAQAVRTQVRLTYTQDGTVLSSDMVDSAARSLVTPTVTVPEGKVFAGWFRETTAEDGTKTLSLVFQPDETGSVSLPEGYELEPMELQALFEDA